MTAYCSLIVRDENDETIRFAHHTVQQYLIADQRVMSAQIPVNYSKPIASHLGAGFGFSYDEARLCLSYLSFGDFKTIVAPPPPKLHFARKGILDAVGPGSIPTVLGLRHSSWSQRVPTHQQENGLRERATQNKRSTCAKHSSAPSAPAKIKR